MSKKQDRIVIIGGGAAGMIIGWMLNKEGYQNVSILEKSQEVALEASGLNSGKIRHYHPDPDLRAGFRNSVSMLNEFQNQRNESYFTRRPSIWLFKASEFNLPSGNQDEDLSWNQVQPDNVPDVFRQAWSFDEHWVTFQNDGILDSVEFAKSLHRELEASDVNMIMSTEVAKGERAENEWQITTASGDEHHADVVINAAGIWANHVARCFGLESKEIQPVERHLFQVRDSLLPKQYGYFYDDANGFYFRGTEEGTIISYRDDMPVEPGKPVQFDHPQGKLENVISGSYEHIHGFELEQYWAGKFAKTPDQKPVIQQDPEANHFIWATGLNDYGMSLLFQVGKQVLDLL